MRVARGEQARSSEARRAAFPSRVRLQLATPADRPPSGKDWLHEVKFDGYRIAARLEKGRIRLLTRNGLDWTDRFPRIAQALESIEAETAVIDGEIIAQDDAGRPDFALLQAAAAGGDSSRLSFQAFDLLYLNGLDTRRKPIEERKSELEVLLGRKKSPRVHYTGHLELKGEDVFDHACRIGLEGIVSKRAGSQYRPGRGMDWIKSVCLRNGDFVIGGFTEPKGSRKGFGALLLGEHDAAGNEPVFVGKVGTGFSDEELAALRERLEKLVRKSSPFSNEVTRPVLRGGVTWTRPELVATVLYSERTGEGMLRHPRFKTLREDKPADEASGSANEVPVSKETNRSDDETVVAGVKLSNPDRVMYPGQGVTKADLARYYESVSEAQLRWLAGRPLSLVRCPEGARKECFYQKHPGTSFAASVPRLEIQEKDGTGEYLMVRDTGDVVALVQAGVLEIHAWGSVAGNLERPDLLVFDLDPGAGVSFDELKEHARRLRALLEEHGLVPFLRTTGGKGLHLVVPIEPDVSWDDAKEVSRSLATELAARDPGRLTVVMSKRKRKGRVFIDYLRNGRGATAITNWSTRSRPGAPVAVPLRWTELGRLASSDAYDIDSARRRLRSLKKDAWDGFERGRASISKLVGR